MKYFILTIAVLATVLSSEAVVAQVPAREILTTPGTNVGLPGGVSTPFGLTVPANPNAFLHGGGM